MSKTKTKELFISLIMFVIIALMTTQVFATDGITADSLLDELNKGEVNDDSDNYNDSIGEGDREQLGEDLSDSNNEPETEKKDDEETEKKDETTSDDKLTHTGIEDFPVFIAIPVLGVSMIFAYKKAKEYNI